LRSDNYWRQALIASESLADEIDNLIQAKIDKAAGFMFGDSSEKEIKENIKGILLALLTLRNETDEEQ
jgi:hypothetical protein